MLWALAARIRDERYVATVDDMRALVAAFRGKHEDGPGPAGAKAAKARIREVLAKLAAEWPDAPFSVALSALETA